MRLRDWVVIAAFVCLVGGAFWSIAQSSAECTARGGKRIASGECLAKDAFK